MTREQIILPYIQNKKILDIGSVDEDAQHSFWNFLKSKSLELTGIDLRPSSERGVVAGNMESYEFSREFDVIVAGDVLIQTDNQGLLLDNIHKHLETEGRLIITLPNAKWPTVFLKPSSFQTGWHDQFTLKQLLGRHGFGVSKIAYYFGNRHTLGILRSFFLFRQGIVAICYKKK